MSRDALQLGLLISRTGPAVWIMWIGIQACAAQTRPSADIEEPEQSAPAPAAQDRWQAGNLTGNWGGLRSDLENRGLQVRLAYMQQYQQNFRGGLETHHGHRLSGSYDFDLLLDFERMGLIEGGSFLIRTKGNWSDGVNPDKVGALFNVNDDAVDDLPIYVRYWWYQQKLLQDKIELRIGRIRTNKDFFDVSMYANHEDRDFLNRLSIRNSTIPHRNGIGAFLKVAPLPGLYFQTAAVDPDAGRTRTGFDTAFHGEDRWIGYWELGADPVWQSAAGPMPGNYRIGWWYDPRAKTIFCDTDGDDEREPQQRGDDLGFYLGFDQLVWRENDEPEDRQGLGLFARYGHAHRDVNRVSDHWSAGVSYKGLVPTRDRDMAGFAVSQAILSSRYRHELHERADRETVYEWYYAIQVTPWCIITPDVQVITNPGGDKDDRDAIVGGLRIRLIF